MINYAEQLLLSKFENQKKMKMTALRGIGRCLVLLLISITSYGQEFHSEEKKAGYSLQGDDLIFIFDEQEYNVIPEKVVVTGIFRGWSQNMDNASWQLKKWDETSGIWILSINNSDFSIVSPGSPFKYRIDDGKWMDPPADADNEKGGNLIFMHDTTVPSLKAEIIDKNKKNGFLS